VKETWKFLMKPLFTLPAFTKTLGQAFLVFALMLYVAYWGTKRFIYRHEHSHEFDSIGSNALAVRNYVRVLSQLEVSRLLTPATEADLLKQIDWTEGVRRNAPKDLADIVGLQQSMTYLMVARLEQERMDSGRAASHQQSARVLLQSLGWHDLSDADLNPLADKELKWKWEPPHE